MNHRHIFLVGVSVLDTYPTWTHLDTSQTHVWHVTMHVPNKKRLKKIWTRLGIRLKLASPIRGHYTGHAKEAAC